MSTIALILTPGFADWEYAYIAGTGGPFYGMEVAFFTPSPGEVVSQGRLAAQVPRGTSEIADWRPNVVVVIGGTGWERDGASDVSDVLLAQHERGGTVAGICGGTLALARAGLLNDVRHTSIDLAFLEGGAPSYGGAALYEISPRAVVDGRIVTAPGTAATSFAAAVFGAAGLDAGSVGTFRAMTAAEHG